MKASFFFLLFLFSCCSAELDTEWWKHTIIYEILPYSFKDSDGDGIGDLKGITSKLDHFVDMKVETLHLTPMYQSTFLDMGYDITNYSKIYPPFGTMDDFDELIREMNKRGMKLILDLVFNHSGDKHLWFKKSVENIAPYSNLYVWRDASGFDEQTKQPIPPNKWHSVFGGSAWKWNEKRQQFYLHQFMEEQPDFNLNNVILKKELKKIIKFWLDRGVSGFRLDAAIFYFEDKYLRDDDNQLRLYNQKKNYQLVHEFRLFLDEYNQQNGGIERIFLAEAHSDDHHVLKFYGTEDYPVAHFPYAFQLEAIYSEINANQINDLIEPWLKSIPEKAVSVWMTQDHDGKRVGTRIRPEYSDLLTMISMMLPGTVGVYYGQEIAMTNGHIQEHEKKDISGGGDRDPTRLIMQWDDSLNAGFTENDTPYLPPSPDFLTKNVKYQSMQEISHYNMFKDLSTLRKNDIFKYGNFEKFIPSEFVYVFTRSYENQKLLIVVNFDGSPSRVNLMPILSEIPQYGVIGAASVNAGYRSGFELDKNFWNGFVMNPRSSIVIQLHFWKNSPNEKNFSAEKPSVLNYTVTDQHGETKAIKIVNGIVKVNGKVVHIASVPTTKFSFDQHNIYADGEPIYNLNPLKNQNTPQPVPTAHKNCKKCFPPLEQSNADQIDQDVVVRGKSFHIQIKDGIAKVNGKVVYTAPYRNAYVYVNGDNIYADGVSVYDLTELVKHMCNSRTCRL